MAKILLGWEFGGGFGHIGTLVSLAEALQQAGHTPVIAAAYRDLTRPVWEGKGIEVIGAPMLRPLPSSVAVKPAVQPRSTFADVLARIGNYTVERIVRLGRGWARILAETKPDLVFCEFAPNLAFQTLHRIPTITVGKGYSVPPAGRPFPVVRFWEQDKPDAESLRAENTILTNLNAAAAHLGLGGIEYVTDLFGGDEVFVCCLPELDCYQRARRSPAIGSIVSTRLEPRTEPGVGVFAYLNGEEDTPAWIRGLEESGSPAEAYIKDRNNPPLLSRSVQILQKPANLQETLPEKAVLFHHGGATMAEMAVRMGVPQLILPRHLEQVLTGRLVATLGAGEIIEHKPARQPLQLGSRLARMAHASSLQTTAMNLAKTIAARATRPAIDVIMEAVGKYV